MRATKTTSVTVALCMLLYTSNVLGGVMFAQHSEGSARSGQTSRPAAPAGQTHAQPRQPNTNHQPQPNTNHRPATRPPGGGQSTQQNGAANQSRTPPNRTPPPIGHVPPPHPVSVPPGPPPRPPTPYERQTQLRVESRQTWQSAADYERKSLSLPKSDRREYHQQALTQYMHSVSNLEQTRLSQGEQVVAGNVCPFGKKSSGYRPHVISARPEIRRGQRSKIRGISYARSSRQAGSSPPTPPRMAMENLLPAGRRKSLRKTMSRSRSLIISRRSH